MAKRIAAKILVIKIGTSVLTGEGNSLDTDIIKDITEQVAEIKKNGFAVIIVTSGAIVVGMQLLHLNKRPEYLPEIQACAAIGQAQLMKIYDDHFKKVKLTTAQVLLTQDDINDRTRYLNARNTMLALLEKDVIPIVNENDTVSTEEIKFGDNDRLSSLVANLIEAQKLIIMSDVEGLYKFDKKDKTKKEIIQRVERITDEIESQHRPHHDAVCYAMRNMELRTNRIRKCVHGCHAGIGEWHCQIGRPLRHVLLPVFRGECEVHRGQGRARGRDDPSNPDR